MSHYECMIQVVLIQIKIRQLIFKKGLHLFEKIGFMSEVILRSILDVMCNQKIMDFYQQQIHVPQSPYIHKRTVKSSVQKKAKTSHSFITHGKELLQLKWSLSLFEKM